MGAVKRGIKNAFRNVTRTISIVFILSISICLTLVMLLSLKTVQEKIADVKSSVGNVITVSPAGVRGFEGGGELLTDVQGTTISGISHVAKVTSVLSDRLTPGQDTSLAASLDAGSFGRRMRVRNGETQTPPDDSGRANSSQTQRSFTMPISVTAVNDLSVTQALNVSSFNLTSGAKFDATKDENVAIMGKDLAAKNNLKVGSTFTAYSNTITVVGIYDAGNTFSNSNLIMQLKALQRLSSQSGQAASMIVQTDSIDNIDGVASAIKTKVGSDKIDVVTSQEATTETIKPLENIKTISFYSLIGSLFAGAVIIFLLMVMIVRERRREIGVLKAIGASNFIITTQFVVESIVLTIMSSTLGILGGFLFANPILKALVTNSMITSQGPGQFGRGGGFGMRIMSGASGIQNSIRNIQAVVGLDIILYGLLVAIGIAIFGSAIPAFLISKVRPAEVMRAE